MKLKRTLKLLTDGTCYLQAPLKAFELDDRILKDKYGLNAKKIDYYDDSDMETWMSIIHTSYDDCHFTMSSARNFFTDHSYFQDAQTFIFYDIPTGEALATVSIGLYKNNPQIGGDFRIGVTEKAQGRGLGRLCILYAFSKLATMGVTNGESAIAFKRKKSLFLHYSLGFRPQFNNRFLAEKNHMRWLKNLNLILKARLFLSYRSFLRRERRKYISK